MQPQIAVAFLGGTRSNAPDAPHATREASEAALWGGPRLTRAGPLRITLPGHLGASLSAEERSRYEISGRHGSNGRRISDKGIYLLYEAFTKGASSR